MLLGCCLFGPDHTRQRSRPTPLDLSLAGPLGCGVPRHGAAGTEEHKSITSPVTRAVLLSSGNSFGSSASGIYGMPGPLPRLLGTEDVLALGYLHSSGVVGACLWVQCVQSFRHMCVVMGVEIGGLFTSLSTWVSVSWERVPLLGVNVPPGIHVSSLPGFWPQLAGPGQQGAQPLGPRRRALVLVATPSASASASTSPSAVAQGG